MWGTFFREVPPHPFKNLEKGLLTKDFICGFWIPNYNSLSRQDPYYGQHLAGSTMSSSYTIYEFMKAYSDKSGNAADDEELKQRLLNMTIYSMYNLYDFIITVASTDYKPKEVDWYLLRDYCFKLKEALKEYYDEKSAADQLEKIMETDDRKKKKSASRNM